MGRFQCPTERAVPARDRAEPVYPVDARLARWARSPAESDQGRGAYSRRTDEWTSEGECTTVRALSAVIL